MPWLPCQSDMGNQVRNKGLRVCLVFGWKIKALKVNATRTIEENSCNMEPCNFFFLLLFKAREECIRQCLLLKVIGKFDCLSCTHISIILHKIPFENMIAKAWCCWSGLSEHTTRFPVCILCLSLGCGTCYICSFHGLHFLWKAVSSTTQSWSLARVYFNQNATIHSHRMAVWATKV